MKTTCQNCGAENNIYLPPYMEPKQEIKPVLMDFYVEGNRTPLWVKEYNDQFFEVTSGKYKGNLVHRWDLVKK